MGVVVVVPTGNWTELRPCFVVPRSLDWGVLEPKPANSKVAATMAAAPQVVHARARRSAAIVVLKSNDVVLASVLAQLDLDDDQRLVVVIGNPVGVTEWYVDALACASRGLMIPDGAGGGSSDDHPVLSAVFVGLKRQPRMRVHLDALDLVALTRFEDVP